MSGQESVRASMRRGGNGIGCLFVTFVVPAIAWGDGPRDAFWPHARAETAMTIQVPHGQWVAPAGDVDGDGADDMLISMTGVQKGFALLFGGEFVPGSRAWNDPSSRNAVFAAPPLTFKAGRAYGVGDANGDGFADFVLGPIAEPGAGTVRTWLVLVFGGPHLPGRAFDLAAEEEGTVRILAPPGEIDMFLSGVSSVEFLVGGGGDFNGDGLDDLAIGVEARSTQVGGVLPGVAYVLYGRRVWPGEALIGDLAEEGWTVTSSSSEKHFPAGIAFAGDLDGDGLDELAVSAGSELSPAIGSPSEDWWRTTVLFGGSVLPGSAMSLSEIQQSRLTMERCMLTGGAGDTDKDGRGDALLLSQPLTLGECPPKGYLLYGGTRQELNVVQGPAELVLPRAARIEGPPLSSVYPPHVLSDSGVTVLSGGVDWNGDGVPDIAVGCPRRKAYFGDLAVANAGAIGIVAGSSLRKEALLFDPPYMEGLFAEEALGRYLFFTQFDGRSLLAAVSGGERSPRADGEMLISLFFSPPWNAAMLSIEEVRDESSSVLLLGAGFALGLAVLFGETPALSVEVFSESAARAVIPPGPPGVAVTISARMGATSATAPNDYTYPVEDWTPSVDLAALRGSGVTRLFAGAAGRQLVGAILAGDMDGDFKGEIVVQVWAETKSEFLILSEAAADAPDVDVTAPGALCEARFEVAGSDFWNLNMDAGDFDGDGFADLALVSRVPVDAPCTYAVVFGGAHLHEGSVLTPGHGLLLIHCPQGIHDALLSFPGDADGDGIVDLVGNWRLERPEARQAMTFDCLVLHGSPIWRREAEVTVQSLCIDGRAAIIVGGGQYVPMGDIDGLPPGDNLHAGYRQKTEWEAEFLLAVSSTAVPAGETWYGDLIDNDALATTAYTTTFPPAVMTRGPVDLDGFGTPGCIVTSDRFPGAGPVLPKPGRILSMALDAWEFLPADLRVLSAGFQGSAIFEDDVSGGVYVDSTRSTCVPTPIGDFDGDGATDFLLPTARAVDKVQRVLLLFGGPHMLDGAVRGIGTLGGLGAELNVPGKAPEYMIGPARDVDGDGFSDIIVGFSTAVGTRESYLIRGRAGRFAPTVRALFRRGDANTDGKVDIADAIGTLSYLFARGAAPSCLDAADANDDETLNLADAVRTLGYLFANAGDLPRPFTACGTDPLVVDDKVGCESFRVCNP